MKSEADTYSRYVASEHVKATAEAQRDLVKKLLMKLKESDREIITLYLAFFYQICYYLDVDKIFVYLIS